MTDDTNIFTYAKQMGLVTQKLKYLKTVYYTQTSNLPNGPHSLNKMCNVYLLCHRVKNNLLGGKKKDSNRGGKLNPAMLGVDKVGKTVLSYTLVETETSTDFEKN